MFRNCRLVAFFNLPLAAVTGWLVWRSLDWPLVGDATIFHFIAGQMRMGAVPYRDIFDINMPLIYGIHAAIVEIGGMGDVAWRAFDLAAATVLSTLVLMLVWPAGRAAAILAALIMLVTHLLFGPYSAGQRDFLMLIPIAVVALASAMAAEDHKRRWLHLLLAGAAAMTAASLKPTGILLLVLPALAIGGLHWRQIMWVALGGAIVAVLLLGTLAAWDGLSPFIAMIRDLLPRYGSSGTRTVAEILEDAAVWLSPVGGLAVAAGLNIAAPKPPRVRVMIGLTAFGLLHLLAQRKGWFYHVYPMGFGLVCWGAWSLASLTPRRAFVCLMVLALTIGWRVTDAQTEATTYPSLQAASMMQSVLETRLPRGARVQMLDADYGAFLAMARAGMRQATPHIQWFSLMLAEDPVRRDFIAALEANPPSAILLTNSEHGFDAADNWPEFTALLASHYVLAETDSYEFIAWRFYLHRRSEAQ